MILIYLFSLTSIIIILLLLKDTIIRGDQYLHMDRIKLNDIPLALSVLEEANVGGYFKFRPINNEFFCMYILKNQNESEWWYEFILRNKYIDNMKSINILDKAEYYLEKPPPKCNIKFNKYHRYYIGSNNEEITNYLTEYYKKAYNKSADEETSIRFKYLYTLKGFTRDDN